MRRLLPLMVFLALACVHDPTRDAPTPANATRSTSFDRRDSTGAEIPPPPMPLTAEEIARAGEMAGRDLRTRDLLDERTYFVRAELVIDKAAPSARRALVQHYRYRGDLTLTSYVDLDTQKVLEVRQAEHVPTGISREEFEEARQLALADPRVREMLRGEEERFVIEPLPVGTMSRDDRWFGRRIVRLLFRLGADYLSEPLVFVDLTERAVLIESPAQPQH